MAAVVNAVEVITELVPRNSQTDLKCENKHEMILSIVPKIEKISSPKITGAPNKRKTWTCWSVFRGGHKDDQRAGTFLL